MKYISEITFRRRTECEILGGGFQIYAVVFRNYELQDVMIEPSVGMDWAHAKREANEAAEWAVSEGYA